MITNKDEKVIVTPNKMDRVIQDGCSSCGNKDLYYYVTSNLYQCSNCGKVYAFEREGIVNLLSRDNILVIEEENGIETTIKVGRIKSRNKKMKYSLR